MPKNLFKEKKNESLLNKGINIIIQAFNEQKNEFSENISLLQTEIKKLKEENFVYKNKLTTLQQKLNSLSKTVLLLDEDGEETKNEEEKNIGIENINSEINSINKNILNNKKINNSISRNNRTSLGKNISVIKKKFITNTFNSKDENKKINSIKNIDIKHKRTYTNNFKNLKYSIKNPEKPSYMKALNYLKNNTNNNHNNNNNENISNNSEISINNDPLDKIDLKEIEKSSDNDSEIYKKLNLFLEESKRELNALDYENILELLKSFETGSDINIKKKIKKIINNRNGLIKLFEDIFES